MVKYSSVVSGLQQAYETLSSPLELILYVKGSAVKLAIICTIIKVIKDVLS